MEEIKTQENILEKNTSTKVETIVAKPLDQNQINIEIENSINQIIKNQETIIDTTEKVNNIRHEIGAVGEENNIPSLEFNKKEITKLELRKAELEKKLLEILKSNISEDYKDIIGVIKQSKIDWANSRELERRLKLKGADNDDILNIKEWLINNVNNVKTFILPKDKYEELKSVIYEMTDEKNVLDGEGFYSPGGRDDLPEEAKNSIFMKENTVPPMRTIDGVIPERKYVDKKTFSHELGHATQDGLLEAEEFSNTWSPKFKESAPDKEYVGQIQETDTRIRSMFNTLGDSLNIENEIFGKKHLEILRDKLSKGMLDKDTKDLLEHYDDGEIIKMANRMPAI